MNEILIHLNLGIPLLCDSFCAVLLKFALGSDALYFQERILNPTFTSICLNLPSYSCP
jgi:hypothetical protein